MNSLSGPMVGFSTWRAISATATGATSIGSRKTKRNSPSPGTRAFSATATDRPMTYCSPTEMKAISVVVPATCQKRGLLSNSI